MLITVLSLLVVLGVLVFVHEAGHFLAAKWAGIYVHRFSLGLGAPIPWLTTRRGETEYSISWLPLGGYVKMASREEEATSAALEGGTPLARVPADRVFEAQPVWKRMVVIMAGVTMNVLFAWLVYVGLAAVNGHSIDPVTTVGRVVPEFASGPTAALAELNAGDRIVRVNGTTVGSWDDVIAGIAGGPGPRVTLELADGRTIELPVHADALEQRIRAARALLPYRAAVIDSVLAARPAARAGLAAGDTIVGVSGTPVTQWYDVVEMLDSSAGRPVDFAIARQGKRLQLRVTPETDTVPGPEGKPRTVGRVGIALRTSTRSERYTLGGAIAAGTEQTLGSVTYVVRTVKGLLSRRVSSTNLGGPILIAQQAGQSARLGLGVFLGFMALVSVNLAVLNLLPVPVLDGGQMMFLVAEAVLRRPLALKIRERLTAVGLVLVLLLMVFAFANDIRRLLGNL